MEATISAAGLVARVRELERLQKSNAALVLLRLDLAPLAVAVLGSHLHPQNPRLPAPQLHELIEGDLEALRDEGWEYSRSAQAYCDDWRRAGILVRTNISGTNEEQYELSAWAQNAIHFVSGINQPRSTATGSRLGTISKQLESLVKDSDASKATRLEILEAQKRAIEQEIAEVKSGNFRPIEAHEAKERVLEIISLASSVPNDFSRVRDQISVLNNELHSHVVGADLSRGDVLEEVFTGIDQINHSEAGRSFNGFYDLLRDLESSARFDDQMEQLLSRDFALDLPLKDRSFLRNWRSLLLTESDIVQSTMVNFSRSLRRFVQSRRFEMHRQLSRDLVSAQHLASQILPNLKVWQDSGCVLDLTGFNFGSISAWKLFNPEDGLVTEELVIAQTKTVSLEELHAASRESEIDYVELAKNVNATLRELKVASIADVLERFPASQGVASVVGLLVIAKREGQATTGLQEVSWVDRNGTSKVSNIPSYIFSKEVKLTYGW
ncbi:hypothetical protein BK816_08500 [Boudabousia tangfeifanii]|uniref:DUF3375 domain-containing protein n=1 Tax=Boudabousia tangfeifanii TaxID=1912795 RepID=A0A1D9MLZ0_9ACTO|nr:DUF3375 domain-containing protein [Boudabousia tangfeifanii]AOZ73312.1 hypothetical protein BK816_08500 [Boudabousia tangfeifanii]